MQLEASKLDEVIQAAFDAAGAAGKNSRRWQTAIAKARQQFESNPFMHYDGDALLILSPDSLQLYRANGACECKAFAQGMPCWHRAAARIVANYHRLHGGH